MDIRDGESIIHTARRHHTPYIIQFIGALIAVSPVYFFTYTIADQFGVDTLITSLSILTFFVVIGFTLSTLNHALDKLIITNYRIIFIDWRSLLSRYEEEVELSDIQNISVAQLGILSKLHIFDYGTLEIESSASQTSIIFHDCTDPDGVKRIIYVALDKLENKPSA